MMLDEDNKESAGYTGPLDLPDEHEPPEADEDRRDPSLTDDLFALVEDGRTYAEAEVAFQKSRASFMANRAKGAIAFGLGAFGVFHLALIALTVGAVFALVPLVGPWAATAIVTVVLVVAGLVLLRLLKGRIDDILNAFSERKDD